MSHVHAVVWMDHRAAKVVGFSLDAAETVEVHSQREDGKLHRKSGRPGSGHAADDHRFFDEIVVALSGVREVLVTGPGTAKTAFQSYLVERHPDVARRVTGVETLDHPSDGELLDHARKHFKRIDQLGLA
jgi:stalled ribosome rescue protein Dom34